MTSASSDVFIGAGTRELGFTCVALCSIRTSISPLTHLPSARKAASNVVRRRVPNDLAAGSDHPRLAHCDRPTDRVAFVSVSRMTRTAEVLTQCAVDDGYPLVSSLPRVLALHRPGNA